MPRPRSWTDEQLTAAVAASRTLSEVCKRLGLRPGKYEVMRSHIQRLGIAASHIPRADVGASRSRRSWTDDDLRRAVELSDSVSEVSRRLGYAPNGGIHRMILSRIRSSGVDKSHFTGRRWMQDPQLRRNPLPLAEILVVNSTYNGTSTLRKRLIAEGLLPGHCQRCGLQGWQGELLPLHLDHVNGDHTDNRLENLRILCPNCHALTDTWCGRNRRRSPTGRRPSV